jgi:hypothetical protein
MEVSGPINFPAPLPPGANPGTPRIGGWVGPRTGLDGFGVEKISCPYQDSKFVASSPSLFAMPNTLYLLLSILCPFNIQCVLHTTQAHVTLFGHPINIYRNVEIRAVESVNKSSYSDSFIKAQYVLITVNL